MLPLLLCTDLDRTLLPNGDVPESPLARPLFRRFVEQGQVTLAYVSGRHLALVEAAMHEYELPQPDYILADVGTSIYHRSGSRWRRDQSWNVHIGQDFNGFSTSSLQKVFADLAALELQEPAKQGQYKLSFYLDPDAYDPALVTAMEQRLQHLGVAATLIWSMDDITGQGLLDIVPAAATKLGAVRFLMQAKGFAPQDTVFAGDSGNDMAVLTSNIPGIVVANARSEIKHEATTVSQVRGTGTSLYIAAGNFYGMNGHYSAGILEGVAHFRPDLRALLQGLCRETMS